MKIKISVIFLSALIFAACRSNPFEGGTKSKEELVRNFTAALTQGNADTIRSYLIRKKEYVEGIHPYTPEAKGIVGEEWWNTMIIRRRDMLTNGLIEKFKGKTCSVEITGKEKKIEKFGPVTFYREIPVKIVCGDKDNLYTDDSRYMFGIVVEKYGVFKLLNILND
jgi:hypothetical protein